MRAKSGFTLVEILIVVVILGILAAIVIPQFTNASTEAKDSSLRSDLQMLRSQIELYKIQHNDQMPSDAAVGILLALTDKTDQYGAAGGTLGAYLRTIPTNQFVDDLDLNNKISNLIKTGAGACPADGTSGWWFDTTSGTVFANSLGSKWPGHIDY